MTYIFHWDYAQIFCKKIVVCYRVGYLFSGILVSMNMVFELFYMKTRNCMPSSMATLTS
jgi:hypothetical protein